MSKLWSYLKKSEIYINDKAIYIQAFTHPTFSNENKTQKNYQKLEFLGDSVLGMLVTKFIFQNFPKMDEGNMTILKASVVQGNSLSDLALAQGFDRLIRFGKTRENLATNKKILEDVFEAFIGALYLDQGLVKVENFLAKTIYPKIKECSKQNLKNPKTILQEYLQAEKRGVIQYTSEEKDHIYYTEVIFDGTIFGKGHGNSKKEAEINAAKEALKKVGIN